MDNGQEMGEVNVQHHDVVRVPENRETQETAFDTRHRIATLAVAMERAMDDEKARSQFFARLDAEPLPQRVKDHFHAIAVNAAVERLNAYNLSLREKFEGLSESQLGETLFRRITGFDPHGDVLAKRKGGYFCVACKERDDYEVLHTSGFRRDHAMSGIAEGSYRRENLLVGDGTLSLLIAHGDLDDSNAVFTHEYQHWVNDRMLADFALVESGIVATEASAAARNIKSEVISYIRDGAQARAIADITHHYHDLLFTGDAAQWKTTVRSIAEQFDAHLAQLFPTRQARAVIIMHLVRVPLERMPRVMQRLGDHYRARMEASGAHDQSDDVHRAMQYVDAVVHPDISDAAATLTTHTKAFAAAKHEAKIAATGEQGVFTANADLVQYRDAIHATEDAIAHDLATLSQKELARGARYPLVSYIHQREARQQGDGVSKKFATHIVRALEIVSQKTIDAAYAEATGRHTDYSTQHLASLIERHLYSTSGHRLRVASMTPWREPRQFSMQIVQEKSDVSPETTYHVNLYPSFATEA